MSDTPHAAQMDAILGRLRAQLPGGVDVDEVDSREAIVLRLRKVPSAFVLYGGQQFDPPKVNTAPERINSEWEWGVFIAAKGRREAPAGLDYMSLLRGSFKALRGFAAGEPGKPLHAIDERFFDAIPGAVVYLQRWTNWRQEVT